MASDGPDDSPVSGDATGGHGGEIDRRRLIRGASLVAGGALVGIVASPGTADANTGDPWVLGIPSSAQNPTQLSLLATTGPALVVESSGFGPVVSSKASGGANIALFGATDGLAYPDDPNSPGAVGYAGVLGLANVNDGVIGQSTSGFGVLGRSSQGSGVVGTSDHASSPAIKAQSNASNGTGLGLQVEGKSLMENTGFGPVVSSLASGGANIGVFGATDGLDYPGDPNQPNAVGFAGVLGLANVNDGVIGQSTSGFGVLGRSSQGSGVVGTSDHATSPAIKAQSNASNGTGLGLQVEGKSLMENTGFGPVVSSLASGGANIGVFGATDGLDYPFDPNQPNAVGFAGVLGLANVNDGVIGQSTSGFGVLGRSLHGSGVVGTSDQATSPAIRAQNNATGGIGLVVSGRVKLSISGSSTVKAGQASSVVTDKRILLNSIVLVTFLNNPSPGVLSYVSVKAGSFTVHMTKPPTNPVRFAWTAVEAV